ncbi:MAG: DUF4240 domain-containing protein [Cyanobacteria bacterium SZAS-4]|nr:DUF4240 domain-containing protein [Cyanobacteria bacterium SZAS-4]
MEVEVSPVTYDSIDGGCFPLAGRLIRENAPNFGPAVKLLRIEPHFEDLKGTTNGDDHLFKQHCKAMLELPACTFNRVTGTISIRYRSAVCLGRDLLGKASISRHKPPSNNTACLLESFYTELIKVLQCLFDLILPSDQFDTERFLAWVKSRFDELPFDNEAVFQLAQRREKTKGPDLADISAMTEKKFWTIIGRIDKHILEEDDDELAAIEPAVSSLAQCSLPQIKSFYNHLSNALYAIDTRKHQRATNQPYTDDSFLYIRCYVVGMGLKHYKSVLADPTLMPQDYLSLEWLLSAASMAWERATGYDEFDIDCTQRSFESGSNREAWGFLPSRIHSLYFENTKESIESMLATDRRESATLGINKATTFIAKLNDLEFHSKYQNIAIQFMPTVEHGAITLHSQYEGEINKILLNGGIDTIRFIGLSEVERDIFFINLAARALRMFCTEDKANLQKIEQSLLFALDNVANGADQL